MKRPEEAVIALPGVHPPVQRLIAYARGELDRRDAARVRKHATECADCGDQLAALMLLREHMILGIDETPARRAEPPSRGRPFAAVVAAAALVLAVLAAATLVWLPRPVDPGTAGPSALAELPPWHDEVLFAGFVELCEVVFDPDVQRAGLGTLSDYERLAAAVAALGQGDRDEAMGLLEPFGQQHDRFGSALYALLRYMEGSPAAGNLLEAYYVERLRTRDEGNPYNLAPGAVSSPEADAFYFLALLRQRGGDEAGALAALGWIAPETDVGRAATRVRERIQAGLR